LEPGRPCNLSCSNSNHCGGAPLANRRRQLHSYINEGSPSLPSNVSLFPSQNG